MTKKRLSGIVCSILGIIIIIYQLISGKAFIPKRVYYPSDRAKKLISRRAEPEFYWISIAIQGVGIIVIIVFSSRD